jgi:hypothetical protein
VNVIAHLRSYLWLTTSKSVGWVVICICSGHRAIEMYRAMVSYERCDGESGERAGPNLVAGMLCLYSTSYFNHPISPLINYY